MPVMAQEVTVTVNNSMFYGFNLTLRIVDVHINNAAFK